MTITTLSSRQFNQDASRAKKAAMAGPVFITDRGRPAHVLLTLAANKKMTASQAKIADLLAMLSSEDFDFDVPQLRDLARPADFS
jgi:hypothetical protein